MAAGPVGAASTLRVAVDGAPWTEVDGLLAAGPQAHVYSTRPNADGTLVVQFGDGTNGALLPAGRNNVTSRYLSASNPLSSATGCATSR